MHKIQELWDEKIHLCRNEQAPCMKNTQALEAQINGFNRPKAQNLCAFKVCH
jgi:hypothetical protein